MRIKIIITKKIMKNKEMPSIVFLIQYSRKYDLVQNKY